ncbi:MAG: hypothetical protein H6Q89_3600 [Myxococcaceae bacterium]|nr:hypothetical protein [Myxococcaceae bacterium]
MLALALILAAAPPVSKAEAFASARQWEELYLAFAAAPPKDYGAPDRKKLAVALARGCQALEADDAVMAYSLGEKAAQFEPIADALVCVGRTGTKTDQKSAAETALQQGHKAFPKDARFPLELGRLVLSENDFDGAVASLGNVPKKSPQAKEADALLKKARAMAAEGKSAKSGLLALEKDLQRRQDDASRGGAPLPEPGTPLRPGQAPTRTTESSSYESSVDGEGRRLRANAYFRFRYFNGQRDFGQRADYEGKVQGALEESRLASKRILGTARESPTDVILYSKQEFTMHHGAQAAQSIAGFYSESAIRMNDTAEINPQNQSTLVHEYIHAVVDEASGFHDERLPTWLNEGLAEWTEWRYEGHDEGPPHVRKALQNAANSGGLPSLVEMSRGMLAQQDNPGMRYAMSARTVGLMMKNGGADNFLGLIREVGAGQSFNAVLQKRYERDLPRLQEDIESELKSR